MVLSVYVNRKQWKDKSYGTIEKPMPVFLHRIISGDGIEERNKNALRKDRRFPGEIMIDFYLPPKAVQRMRNTPDSVNYKFAEYYLRYLLPEDEFERLFEENNLRSIMIGSNKGNWGRYGLQAFGISVLGPLLFYLINPIIEHFKGNRDAVAYTKTYVNQWDSIKITLPNNLFEQMMQKRIYSSKNTCF